MFNNNVPSLSDIAAVTGNGTNGNNGWNNGNEWWVLIILFAIFGGWGNGYGNRDSSSGNGYSGAMDGYVLATDFANIERKIDGVNNGLCDGFYAQNTNLLNGFANTNAAIANGFAGVNNAVCTLGYQNAELINGVNTNVMQAQFANQAATTALANQISQCCCDNKSQIADLKYSLATDTCAITTALNQAAQNIINNDNANYRALHDENVQAQLDAKDEIIATLRSQADRGFTASMIENQTAQLRNYIQPTPEPAYIVNNPYCNANNYNGYGCNGNSCC